MSKKSFNIDRVTGTKNDTSRGRITQSNRGNINKINAALRGKPKTKSGR